MKPIMTDPKILKEFEFDVLEKVTGALSTAFTVFGTNNNISDRVLVYKKIAAPERCKVIKECLKRGIYDETDTLRIIEIFLGSLGGKSIIVNYSDLTNK